MWHYFLLFGRIEDTEISFWEQLTFNLPTNEKEIWKKHDKQPKDF